jgi:hypothetical protein
MCTYIGDTELDMDDSPSLVVPATHKQRLAGGDNKNSQMPRRQRAALPVPNAKMALFVSCAGCIVLN